MEILREVSSHWDGCIEAAKAACLASHALRDLFQPLMFRTVTIIDQDKESAATMINKLLAALLGNSTLAPLVHELEWRTDPFHLPDMRGYPVCSASYKSSDHST